MKTNNQKAYRKAQKRTAKLNRKTMINNAKKAYYDSKTAAKNAKQQAKGKTWSERKSEIRDAKHAAKIREINAKAAMAETKPGVYKDTVASENKVKQIKAQMAGRTASATALASGMATLGKGLSDEGNQDDALSQAWQAKQLQTIFGKQDKEQADGDSYGLTQGVE